MIGSIACDWDSKPGSPNAYVKVLRNIFTGNVKYILVDDLLIDLCNTPCWRYKA